MATSTVENYLKQLCLEQSANEGRQISMGRLASIMRVVPGTATSMVKALADSGLVEYEPRAGVRLTEHGRQLALHVLRRHRLIELFLVRTLGLDWSVVHDEAEALEHAVSDRVIERIDALLGYPTVDPHGDPIPSSQGHLEELRRMSLADCELGQPRRIARVLDQESEFLRFVERLGLTPGAVVTVMERERLSDAVRIHGSRGEVISLGLSAAAKILVESPPG